MINSLLLYDTILNSPVIWRILLMGQYYFLQAVTSTQLCFTLSKTNLGLFSLNRFGFVTLLFPTSCSRRPAPVPAVAASHVGTDSGSSDSLLADLAEQIEEGHF